MSGVKHHMLMADKLIPPGERSFAAAVSQLVYCNPFTQRRLDLERQALGPDFREPPRGWTFDPLDPRRGENVEAILARSRRLLEAGRSAYLQGGGSANDRERFQDLVFFCLYHQTNPAFDRLIDRAHQEGHGRARVPFYAEFLEGYTRYLGEARPIEPPHLFACFFQIRRAFYHIFRFFIGSTPAAMRLRSAVWESIFTHDLNRYQRALYHRLGEVPTLITGPSGSGKEVVARAIGLSRYLPFDADRRQFGEDFIGVFYPLNLSALSPTLIESELFGHRKGAFTGALQDREGYFAVCGPHGSVFLDEIGESQLEIQVKLLRVLQTRQFTPLGETRPSRFSGKILAATNRSLPEAIAAGTFREDFYYRLRADVIETPPLAELLSGRADELAHVVRYVAEKVAGPAEVEALTADVLAWASRHPDYTWPGNFRELEQCVRNILIRRDYQPAPVLARADTSDLASRLASTGWTIDRLLREYITRVHAQTGVFEETARRLDLDRRTVKKYLAG